MPGGTLMETPQQRERAALSTVLETVQLSFRGGLLRRWINMRKVLRAYKRAILVAERAKGRKETKRG